MRALVVVALAVVTSGCATVGGRLFGPRLPYEARVWLLDAEEDLMTARARAEQAERDVVRAQASLAAADQRCEALRDSPLEREAKAAAAVEAARVVREERSFDLLAAQAGCAERRYAAARARAEVKFKVEGADEAEANALAERAEACAAKLDKRELALTEAEEQLARARAARERESIAAAAQAPLEHPRPWLE
ncbi:MAG: hypothetical protein JNK82_22935 [Myxococcaceae bacterium]|nr:hypothetical protein [Myxococcaceae bacterium]